MYSSGHQGLDNNLPILTLIQTIPRCATFMAIRISKLVYLLILLCLGL